MDVKQYALSVPWESFIVGMLALMAAWYGGEHFILRQVRALYQAVLRIAGGDLQARTGLEQVEGELGQLAEKFDAMAATLQQRERERDAAERKIRDHAHQQTIVAALGQCALVIEDIEALYTQGALMSGQMLAIEYSAVFECLPDGRLLMLSGTGWKSGTVGQTFTFDDKDSRSSVSKLPRPVKSPWWTTSTCKTSSSCRRCWRRTGSWAALPPPFPRADCHSVCWRFSPRANASSRRTKSSLLLSAANTIGMWRRNRRAEAEAGMQKLASFVKENPNPALEMSADGSISYLNAAAEKLAQAVGRSHPREILPPDVSDIVMPHCLQSGAGRSNVETKIGDRTICWSFHPVPANKVVQCYGEDITARLNLEEQLLQSRR